MPNNRDLEQDVSHVGGETEHFRLESELEDWCNRYALSQDYEHRKLDAGVGAKGWLDHAYFGGAGLTLLVEFKLPGEKVQPLKARRMLNLIRLRHRVHLIRTAASFRQLLADPLQPIPPALVLELEQAMAGAGLPPPRHTPR